MLNYRAAPFEPCPHLLPACLYYCNQLPPPQPLQTAFYCYYPTPPPPPQPLDLARHDEELAALQFSHLSLTSETSEVSQALQEPPPHQHRVKRNSGQLVISSHMEFDESKLDVEIRTTVMIKNIPNKLSRDLLITLLDQHCAEENYKLAAVDGSPLSEYDFVYLPMDFRNKCNLGYAFVNFTTPAACWRLHRAMQGRKWAIFSSSKTTHICYARIQGKEALVDNFRRSCFMCRDEKFLPALLSPPRNGTTSLTPPAAVGRRVFFDSSDER